MFRVPSIIFEGNGVQSSVELGRRSIAESLSINGKTHLTSITVPANIETDVFRGCGARQQLKIECLLQRSPPLRSEIRSFIGNHVFLTFLVVATSNNFHPDPTILHLTSINKGEEEDVRRGREWNRKWNRKWKTRIVYGETYLDYFPSIFFEKSGSKRMDRFVFEAQVWSGVSALKLRSQRQLVHQREFLVGDIFRMGKVGETIV